MEIVNNCFRVAKRYSMYEGLSKEEAMAKLLIIADDFTGALDTGVQLSKKGISTKVLVQSDVKVVI